MEGGSFTREFHEFHWTWPDLHLMTSLLTIWLSCPNRREESKYFGAFLTCFAVSSLSDLHNRHPYFLQDMHFRQVRLLLTESLTFKLLAVVMLHGVERRFLKTVDVANTIFSIALVVYYPLQVFDVVSDQHVRLCSLIFTVTASSFYLLRSGFKSQSVNLGFLVLKLAMLLNPQPNPV